MEANNTYEAAGKGFYSFLQAIAFAKANNTTVVEIATGLTRWTPAKASTKKAVRHFIVNADGSQTEFSKVRR